jgi:hypothetical protein
VVAKCGVFVLVFGVCLVVGWGKRVIIYIYSGTNGVERIAWLSMFPR